MMAARARKKVVEISPHVLALEERFRAARDHYDEVAHREVGSTPLSRHYPILSARDTREQVRVSIAYLAYLCARRDGIAAAIAAGVRNGSVGEYVHGKSDPAWLVDMAINRRAGWLDDPGNVYGSAMPVKRWQPGRWPLVVPIFQFPKRGSGDHHVSGMPHPQTQSYINGMRVRVRAGEVRWRKLRERLRHRLTWPEDKERW